MSLNGIGIKDRLRTCIFKMGCGNVYAALNRLWHRSSAFLRDLRFRTSMKMQYSRIVRRIRKYPRDHKIRIAFVVTNVAKWKTQSLLDEIKKHDCFEPFFLISVINLPDIWNHLDMASEMAMEKSYFEAKGCPCELAFDPVTKTPIPFSKFCPDIVFYSEPYFKGEGQRVHDVMKYALCCYVPYGVEYEKNLAIHNLPYFHPFLFLHVAWNEEQARYLRRLIPWRTRPGVILGLGHTAFDQLQPRKDEINKGYVIYAPHFSFRVEGYYRALTISTFMWNGKEILAYAKRHPEIKWVFKPHPRLRTELVAKGGWQPSEVASYYNEWESIGKACYTSDYADLFRESRAMITDSASFLLEYPATGNPIIHLKEKDSGVEYRDSVLPLLDTYYQVSNLPEMFNAFQMVIEHGEDPRRKERLEALTKQNIIGVNAAENIVRYLQKVVCR